MSASFSDIFKYFVILEPLIKDAETAFGPGTGPEKKAAVIDGFERLLQAGAPYLELSHPRYSAMIATATQFVFDELKEWGELPAAPVAAPATPPPPLAIVPLPPPPPVTQQPPVVQVPPPQTPPPPIKGVWNTLPDRVFPPASPTPSDADLKAKGFAPGEAKWVAYDTTGGAVAWAVTPFGSLMARGDYAKVEQIGTIT